MEALRILIVDHEPDLRAALADTLRREYPDALISVLPDGNNLVSQLYRICPHIVLINYSLRPSNGFVKTVLVKACLPQAHVILVLPDDQPVYHTMAQLSGADAWLAKPQLHMALLPTIQSALTRHLNAKIKLQVS